MSPGSSSSGKVINTTTTAQVRSADHTRAGVSGLTTAYLLSKDAPSAYDITVVAKHMPGDYDIEYCSPWAGANYLP